MTALLEVPEIRQRVFSVPVALYHQITAGQKTELLRGTIIEKMSKSPLHFSMIDRVREILAGQIKPGWLVRQEGPLTLTDSEPEPDVAVVLGNKGDFDRAHPSTAELAVEIAVTSLEIDRVKAAIYAEAGVKEYWIVCPERKLVEVYRRPSAQGYGEQTTVEEPAVLESAALPGIKMELAALFA